MVNCLDKELVRSFDYSDVHTNREMYKQTVINGRTYYKHGTHTATSVVGDLYKVNDPSDESFNYVLLIGVARQHPCDVKIDKEHGIEVAAVNAKTNPIAQIKLPKKIDWETFKAFAQIYINVFPTQFIQTLEEIKINGNDPNKFNR